MRLDLYLYENGFAQSRTEAKGLIEDGLVLLNGKLVIKPSLDISAADNLKVDIDRSARKFISRGGIKLDGALREFKVLPKGRICIDIGASSGGFTDCLLQNGASLVIAVDSGVGQMAQKLREDERVIVYESFNARYMTSDSFEFKPSLAVMDVSFISATYIVPQIYDVLDNGGEFICLIKPQFEVGRASIGKGGIVKDDKARRLAVDKVISSAVNCGFEYVNHISSPIKGGDGNVEFLAYFKKA